MAERQSLFSALQLYSIHNTIPSIHSITHRIHYYKYYYNYTLLRNVLLVLFLGYHKTKKNTRYSC